MQQNKSLLISTFTAVAVLLVVLACSPDKAETTPSERAQDSAAAVADSIELVKVHARRVADSLDKLFPTIGYHRLVVRSSVTLDSVRRTFSKSKPTWSHYRMLSLLNRKDLQYVRLGDTLVVADTLFEDLRAYSVFPMYYEGARDIPKLLIISNQWQCYACYEYGMQVRFAAANTGEEHKPTFPGRYSVNWKQRLRLSSLDSSWRLPFTVNIHQYAGSAMHQFDMPGRPVSHSCVRQFLSDAEWVFNWVKVGKLDSSHRPIPYTGTPVIIHGLFDFTRKKGGPWLELTNNQPQIADLPEDPMAVESALIPMSQIPKVVRGALPNRERYASAEEVLRQRGWISEGVKLRESIDYNQIRRDKRKAQRARQKADSAAKANATPSEP